MDREKLIDELVRDEGLRLKPYRDTVRNEKFPHGILSIGIGRNLEERGITRGEAFHLAANDIEEVEVQLDEHLPFWRKLDEVRQRVLVNLAFNMGVGPCPQNPTGKLLTFHNTLALIETGDYAAAAEHLTASAWFKQTGARAERLVAAMRTGVMP